MGEHGEELVLAPVRVGQLLRVPAQLVLQPPALGHVDGGAQHADRTALGVPQHPPLGLHRVHAAVGPGVPELDVAAPLLEREPDRLVHARAVVGVDERLEALERAREAAPGEAMDRLEVLAPLHLSRADVPVPNTQAARLEGEAQPFLAHLQRGVVGGPAGLRRVPLGDGRAQEKPGGGDHGHVELEHDEALVHGPVREGSEAVRGAPDRHAGHDERHRRRPDLPEAQRRPDDQGEDRVVEGIVPKTDSQASGEHDQGHEGGRPEQRGSLRGTAPVEREPRHA